MERDNQPPVDLEAFRATMREAGVEEIVDSTVALYVEQAERIFAALSAAVVAGDTEAVRANAHSLKSASGNVWAVRLAELLNELERAATAGDLTAAVEVYETVKPEYESVVEYLSESGGPEVPPPG